MAAIHSKNYLKFKRYYEQGLWDIERLRAVVGVLKTGITAEEFKQITGQDYAPEDDGA